MRTQLKEMETKIMETKAIEPQAKEDLKRILVDGGWATKEYVDALVFGVSSVTECGTLIVVVFDTWVDYEPHHVSVLIYADPFYKGTPELQTIMDTFDGFSQIIYSEGK